MTVEILDAGGKPIRTFTGTPEDDAKPAGEATFFGPPPPAPPTRKAGLNRFTWDLRHPGAVTFPGMIIWSARVELGPLAVPGSYQVRVSAHGETREAPLTLRLDPRLENVTLADLQEQLDLAIKVRDATSRANQAVIRIRELKQQIDDRSAKAKDRELRTRGELAARKLSAVEQELYQVKNRSGQDPLNFPIQLNNKLAALRRSIETGDGKPTAGSYEVWKVQSAQLETLLARLDGVVQTDVKRFNAALKSNKLAPVQ